MRVLALAYFTRREAIMVVSLFKTLTVF